MRWSGWFSSCGDAMITILGVIILQWTATVLDCTAVQEDESIIDWV